jgi:hypothetical protein
MAIMDHEDHYIDLVDGFYRAAAELERHFPGYEPLAATVMLTQVDVEAQTIANWKRMKEQYSVQKVGSVVLADACDSRASVTLLDNDDAEIIWDFGDGTVVSPKDVE